MLSVVYTQPFWPVGRARGAVALGAAFHTWPPRALSLLKNAVAAAQPHRGELPPPTGTYFLEWFDEDVSVCDIGSDAFFEGEALFLKLIVRDTRSGELQIAWWMRNKQRWRFFDLYDMMTDYRNLQVTLFLGPTKAVNELSAVMLRLPRFNGSAIFWEGVRLYKVLNLTTHKGTPSKWVFRSKAQWLALLEEFGLAGQIIHSTRAVVEDGVAPKDAFLPFAAISTVALLVLLARWRLANPRVGCLRRPDSRAAATTLLNAIVSGVGPEHEGSLALCLDSERFEMSWPASPAHVDVVLHARGGEVSLGPWRALASTTSAPMDASSVLLEAGLEECLTIPAAGLLEKLMSLRKPPIHIIYQVASQVAKWVDTRLYKVASGKAARGSGGSIAKFPDIMDVLDKPDLMNSFLWRHVQGGVRESQGTTSMSLTTDAGHYGMKLDCGFLVFQTGKVAVACPQVLSWGGGCRCRKPCSWAQARLAFENEGSAGRVQGAAHRWAELAGGIGGGGGLEQSV